MVIVLNVSAGSMYEEHFQSLGFHLLFTYCVSIYHNSVYQSYVLLLSKSGTSHCVEVELFRHLKEVTHIIYEHSASSIHTATYFSLASSIHTATYFSFNVLCHLHTAMTYIQQIHVKSLNSPKKHCKQQDTKNNAEL